MQAKAARGVDPKHCVARSLYLSVGDCSFARASVHARRATAMELLRDVARASPEVRVLDPIAAFCTGSTCSPHEGRTLFYLDSNHMSPAGIDRFSRAFGSDFEWAFGGGPE